MLNVSLGESAGLAPNSIGDGGGSICAPPYCLYIVRRVRQQWSW